MELKKINLSLTTLGKVILALAEWKVTITLNNFSPKFKNSNFATSVPYRESKLTRLL